MFPSTCFKLCVVKTIIPIELPCLLLVGVGYHLGVVEMMVDDCSSLHCRPKVT